MSLLMEAAPPLPPMWTSPKTEDAMFKIDVPFAGVEGDWEDVVLAAAQGTHHDEPALGYGKRFAKPKAPRSKVVTLLLGDSYRARSGLSAERYARENGIYAASPYHVLAAISHVGSLREYVQWERRLGLGIFVPTKAAPMQDREDEMFCLWYPDTDEARAKIFSFDFTFASLTLCAFVAEPWEPAR